MRITASRKVYWKKFKRHIGILSILSATLLIIVLFTEIRTAAWIVLSIGLLIYLSNIITMYVCAKDSDRPILYIELQNGEFQYGVVGSHFKSVKIEEVSKVLTSHNCIVLKRRGFVWFDDGVNCFGMNKGEIMAFISMANSEIEKFNKLRSG